MAYFVVKALDAEGYSIHEWECYGIRRAKETAKRALSEYTDCSKVEIQNYHGDVLWDKFQK
jgi:hypothetical protein